tara:strand:- start:930 stop:1271 length:342 start_codon:yes stop_codon:yes gene_type:complete
MHSIQKEKKKYISKYNLYMNKINIIDCTLRDGGYYNNWNSPKDLVNQYLKSVSEADIKYVELGFDGYGQSDRRTRIVNELFFLYSSNNKSKKIVSITPTSYNITTTSVYALNK